MQQGLLATGDAFLIEHNSVEGRDKVWSDNFKGDGTNWLGLQCMLIRDELNGTTTWTSFIQAHIDLNNGKPRSSVWQSTVQKACSAITRALNGSALGSIASGASGAPVCMFPGCSKPTWNGQP